jgi:hypothetical protein
MKIRIVLTRSLASFALLACTLLFVARPAAAISPEASDTGWIANINGLCARELTADNAYRLNNTDGTGNLMPGPRK